MTVQWFTGSILCLCGHEVDKELILGVRAVTSYLFVFALLKQSLIYKSPPSRKNRFEPFVY